MYLPKHRLLVITSYSIHYTKLYAPDFIGIQLSENLKSNNGKILKEPIYKKVFINNQLPEIKNFFNFEIANIFSDNISFPLAAKNLSYNFV